MRRSLAPSSFALLLSLLPAQEASPPTPASLGLDDHIRWRSDGQEWIDNERTPLAEVDRSALVDEACAEAKRRGTLVLWYVPRIVEPGLRGRQMYRAPVLDVYMRQVVFGDPDVADLLNHAFVPLRCAMDPALCDRFDLRPLAFVEPAVVWLDGDGRIVHFVERFRTFHGHWFASLCVRVLEHAGVELEGATVAELRRVGRWRDALALALRQSGGTADERLEIEDLRRLLREPHGFVLEELAPDRRATYDARLHYEVALGAVAKGNDAGARRRFADLAAKYPDTIWGRRARANVTIGPDGRPFGAAFAGFESHGALPEAAWVGLPKDTSWQGEPMDIDAMAAAGVEFLLRAQRDHGGFTDSRYAYWPDSSITPNAWVAITALCLCALHEYRSLQPGRIDGALSRGERYLLDPKNLNRGKNEECYADAYRLLYFARRSLTVGGEKRSEFVQRMDELVAALAGNQRKSGFWSHEYENAFATGAVLQQVLTARAAGADVPDEMIDRAAGALLSARFDNGAYVYGGVAKERPTGVKDSAGRMPLCEGTLLQVGRSDLAKVRAALDAFWTHMKDLETVRRNDFHSDGELAGFFFFHSLFHASEVVALLPEEERRAHWPRFVEVLQRVPEFDGSFVDSHELGRSYGTAMALLVLRNATSER